MDPAGNGPLQPGAVDKIFNITLPAVTEYPVRFPDNQLMPTIILPEIIEPAPRSDQPTDKIPVTFIELNTVFKATVVIDFQLKIRLKIMFTTDRSNNVTGLLLLKNTTIDSLLEKPAPGETSNS